MYNDSDEEKRLPAKVLGVEIGTFDGWDELGDNSFVLYHFQPKDGIAIPAGDLNVMYDEGLFEVLGDHERPLWTAKILDVLR